MTTSDATDRPVYAPPDATEPPECGEEDVAGFEGAEPIGDTAP